ESNDIAQLYCFLFILLLAFGQSTSFKLTSYPARHYVQIVNHLNNKPLTYHCKSADNDLGTTDFYCYFFYENFSASFNVYIENSSLESKCGGDHCIWTVQDDGFYLYNTYLNTNRKMHDWNK
ncbi:s-protein like protein 1, partial [Quercus suber]